MSEIDQSIRELFGNLNRPLAPQATGTEPDLTPVSGIKAVIFDVYGTLICSGVGDISLIEESDRNQLLRELTAKHGLALPDAIADPSGVFHGLIKADHAAARERGVVYGEVDILSVWRRFFEKCAGRVPAADGLRLFAAEYECAVNPVWPYPGLSELLNAIKTAGLPMGIVSNAQFYTPLMLESFLGRSLSGLGFDERLLVWSFEHRLGKPSVELYHEQARRLSEAQGIRPSESLYVGNDMLKDIWAAKEAGFQTALFAGDKRSLRRRTDDDRCANLSPDHTATELAQIRQIIGLA